MGIYMPKLNNFYTINIGHLLYVSCPSIKMLIMKVIVTNLYPALILSCGLCWLRLILGWILCVCVWRIHTLGYLNSFLIFVFIHSDPYFHSPGTHASLNPKNNFGSTFAAIRFPISARKFFIHYVCNYLLLLPNSSSTFHPWWNIMLFLKVLHHFYIFI